MCGIVGVLTNTSESSECCTKLLLDGLKKLQNRGYDSAGICTLSGNALFPSLNVTKYASNGFSALDRLNEESCVHLNSTVGIGHTRWATHGEKTDANSHPHVSSDGKFAVVHNGIIENFESLKHFLICNGFVFKSQTDTEVIVNLLSFYYNLEIKSSNGLSPSTNDSILSTISNATSRLKGTWGLAIVCVDNLDAMYCTKNGSPILIGRTDDCVIATSEQSGFPNGVEHYFVLNNFDICTISKNKCSIDDSGETGDCVMTTKSIGDANDNANENSSKGGITIKTNNAYVMNTTTKDKPSLTPAPYIHWTLKELYEQRESINRAIKFGGRIVKPNSVKLGGLNNHEEKLINIDNIIILGCGTSKNAGQASIHYFKEICNFNTVQVFDGAEFCLNDVPKYGKTALLLLSQSGETKDLHRCISLAKDNDLFTIGVVNVVDSMIAREVDCGCYLNAGAEVAVASTKSFTSHIIVLSMIAIWFSSIHNIYPEKRQEYITDLFKLDECIASTLDQLENRIEEMIPLFTVPLDSEIIGGTTLCNSCFILGKGPNESIANEAALKMKEISYIHSEGYSSSSLKHGPFALLGDNFPVVLIIPDDQHYAKNVNTYHKIKARNANVMVVANSIFEYAENVLYVPFNKTYSNILSVIPLQMLAYKLSIKKGVNPDMPKNLAKVVTVD
jgi:glucosamine--fructose-6-phosphate aminotransferase (isomerizing)